MNGNNPYVTEYDPLEFLYEQEGTQGNILQSSFALDHYGYQGLPQDILDALLNVLGGHTGTIFDVANLGYGQDIWALAPIAGYNMPVNPSDAHIVWNNDELDFDIDMLPSGKSSEHDFTTDLEASAEFDYDMGPLQFMDVFDPSSLALGLSSVSGYDDSIKAGEVRALTPEMIEKTESKYYDPYEATGREELVEKKGKALGKVSTGGFAGSAGRQSGLSGAERLYSGGYQDLIRDILKMRGAATGDVMDRIYGWQELISEAG